MIIKCPECGKDISDKSAACVFCGCPSGEFGQSPAQPAISTGEEAAAPDDSAEKIPFPITPLENAEPEPAKKKPGNKGLRITMIVGVICVLAAALVLIFVLTSPGDAKGGSKFSPIEQAAIDCVSDLRRNRLVDRTSLMLIEDVTYISYRSPTNRTTPPRDVSRADSDGMGYYDFILVFYSANNAYGARVEDSAIYYLKLSGDEYIVEYVGDDEDYAGRTETSHPMLSETSHPMLKRFYILNLTPDLTVYAYEEVSCDFVAKIVGCEYVE